MFFQSHQTHLFLQGADKLYVNLGSGGLTKVYQMSKPSDSNRDRVTVTSTLVESKQWVIIPVPATYSSTTWPVRVSIYSKCVFTKNIIFKSVILQIPI